MSDTILLSVRMENVNKFLIQSKYKLIFTEFVCIIDIVVKNIRLMILNVNNPYVAIWFQYISKH